MPYTSKFVYKCIRVKDETKPLKSRCNSELAANGNGLLCSKCLVDAYKGKIPVLMSMDVSKVFNIKFKNIFFK